MRTLTADDCGCDFDAPDDEPDPYLFARVCGNCSYGWDALHCPHESVQNPCPHCGWLPPGTRTPLQILGVQP